MNNHDNLIIKFIYPGKFPRPKYIRHKDKYYNITNYLKNRYKYYDSIKEVLDRIKFHIDNRPICKYCGNPSKYYGGLKYSEYCCLSCKSLNTRDKAKNTSLKRYRVAHYTNREKFKETCIKKYGVDNPNKNIDIKNKSKETCIKRYGVDNYAKTKECSNKIRQTCIERYGVDNIFKTKKSKENFRNYKTVEKIICTKKRNNTFNTSKLEEILYQYIKEKFPSVKRQYKDKEKYPWCCDFYIPELNLFLELNGTWTHGKHPFDTTSIQDQIILERWKEKSKKHPFYNNAIETWTKRDVNKRNKAKENNLNYKEVWTLEEGKEFIDKMAAEYDKMSYS